MMDELARALGLPEGLPEPSPRRRTRPYLDVEPVPETAGGGSRFTLVCVHGTTTETFPVPRPGVTIDAVARHIATRHLLAHGCQCARRAYRRWQRTTA